MVDSKTRALTGPRQLKTMVPEYLGVYVDGQGYPDYKGWRTDTIGTTIYYESKIDVNLSLDRLTMFPQAALLQDPGIYYRTPSTIPDDPANDMIVLDIISVKQLNIDDLQNSMKLLNNVPAMLESTDDFNQIIMGTFRLMARNNTITMNPSIQVTVIDSDFSSATPFAQDFLWCYRVLMPRFSDYSLTRIDVPASRFILQVVVGQESDLPYMMRLKNSYELQQL